MKIRLRFFANLPPQERRLTISTKVTILRICLVPCIVSSMFMHYWGTAVTLFILASITDGVDGYLARQRNERTFLGAALDPIADKLLLVSCFFTLAYVQSPLFSIPSWFVMLVLCKEFIILSGSCVLYKLHSDLDIKPTLLGKMTTVMQMFFIIWLFACYFLGWVPRKTYFLIIGSLVVLIIASCLQYIRMGYQQIITHSCSHH